MSKMTLEQGERILRGVDSGNLTEAEALSILEGKGAKAEKKPKPTGPTKTFTALSERIAAMDARLDALSENAEDAEKGKGSGVSDEEALRLLEGK